ncbi:hypothetical protein DPSP01_011059 [Paraphaeosphaeria sporulosa]
MHALPPDTLSPSPSPSPPLRPHPRAGKRHAASTHHIPGAPTATSTPTVTVRDFLTARHAFTLPASHAYVATYDAACAHACRSLFRNPRAFGVHFHVSVDDVCGEGKEWERGVRGEDWGAALGGMEDYEEDQGGNTTLWAHFERRLGVGVLGQVEGIGEGKGEGEVGMTTGKKRKRGGEGPVPRTRARRRGGRTDVVGSPREAQGEMRAPWTAVRHPHAYSHAGPTPLPIPHTATKAAEQEPHVFPQIRRLVEESPLFEPDPELDGQVKREFSAGIFEDDGDGVGEWD